MNSGRIEQYYKDDPEFARLREDMLQLAEEFLNKEMENMDWRVLSFEQQAIQVGLIVFDLLKEGKTKEEVLVELIRFRGVKYAPEVVDAIGVLYKKGLFLLT